MGYVRRIKDFGERVGCLIEVFEDQNNSRFCKTQAVVMDMVKDRKSEALKLMVSRNLEVSVGGVRYVGPAISPTHNQLPW